MVISSVSRSIEGTIKRLLIQRRFPPIKRGDIFSIDCYYGEFNTCIYDGERIVNLYETKLSSLNIIDEFPLNYWSIREIDESNDEVNDGNYEVNFFPIPFLFNHTPYIEEIIHNISAEYTWFMYKGRR